MRISLLVFASLLVGIAYGVTVGLWQTDLFAGVTTGLITEPSDVVVPPAPARPGEEPRAIVDSAHYYFGHMERKATGRHTFVISNTGRGTLVLRKGKTT